MLSVVALVQFNWNELVLYWEAGKTMSHFTGMVSKIGKNSDIRYDRKGKYKKKHLKKLTLSEAKNRNSCQDVPDRLFNSSITLQHITLYFTPMTTSSFIFCTLFYTTWQRILFVDWKKNYVQFLGVLGVHRNSGQHLTWTTYPVIHLKFFGCWWPFTRMVPSHPTGSFLPAMISSNLKENIVAMFSLKFKEDISVPFLLKTIQHKCSLLCKICSVKMVTLMNIKSFKEYSRCFAAACGTKYGINPRFKYSTENIKIIVSNNNMCNRCAENNYFKTLILHNQWGTMVFL